MRISPELHRNIAVYAIEHGKSLNAAVEEAISRGTVRKHLSRTNRELDEETSRKQVLMYWKN